MYFSEKCKIENVGESMIRDRIIVGIRKDASRHELLQVRDLDTDESHRYLQNERSGGTSIESNDVTRPSYSLPVVETFYIAQSWT